MHRLTYAFVVVGLIAGCKEPDRPPVRPGASGNPGDMTARPDGGGDPDGGGSGQVSGRVCPITDPRFPTACDPTQDPALIQVRDRGTGNNVLTDGDGEFSVETDDVSNAELIIGANDAALRDSLIPVALLNGSVANVIAPVMAAGDYDSLLLTLGVLEPDDTAAIVAYIRLGGLVVQGAEVVPPDGNTDTLYDDDDGSGVAGWDALGQTESAGAVAMFGIPVVDGTADFTVVNDDSSIVQLVSDVPVFPNTTTFIRVNLQQP
jgi:hypothetical protein